MRLVLALEPSEVEFEAENSGGAYPYLLTVGTLRISARAGEPFGLASTESTSLQVTLDNRGRRAAAIIGRPLRVAARVYDGADLFFSGVISALEYGRVLALEIEA
jgi:hypothetical protein